MGVSGELNVPASLLPVKEHRYPENRSARCGVENIILTLSEMEPRPFSLVAIPTELSRLPYKYVQSVPNLVEWVYWRANCIFAFPIILIHKRITNFKKHINY
jgi:hypothetical protein